LNFDVSVNGKPWKVAIEPAGPDGRYTVTVKGKRRDVDAAWIDPDTLSLIDVRSGMAHEMGLTERRGAVEVAVGGKTFRTVAEKRSHTTSVRPRHITGSDPVSIVAPMPGRVVRILVAVGDKVTAQQAVVVIEAMKMENELRTPRDGVVAQVLVPEGAAIETGGVLLIVH
jgi:biotin carboxyl carrier protein